VAQPSVVFDLSRVKYAFELFLLGGEFDLFEDDRKLAKSDAEHTAAEFSYGKLILSCWATTGHVRGESSQGRSLPNG
jgi:hypothetical protein